MAITKIIKADQIEIVGDWNIQVKTATIINEDGVELSRSNHRHVLNPFTSSKNSDGDWIHTATDISSEASNVKLVCNAVWTDDIKNLYKTWAEAQITH